MPISRRSLLATLAGAPLLGPWMAAAYGEDQQLVVTFGDEDDSWFALRFASLDTRFVIDHNGRHIPAIVTARGFEGQTRVMAVEWRATNAAGPLPAELTQGVYRTWICSQ